MYKRARPALPLQNVVLISTFLLSLAAAQDDEWCDFNGGGSSACEWTGACEVEGCAQRCQVDPTLGSLSNELDDRAFDTDWWQVCPQLARIVRIEKDDMLDFTPTAPAPTSADSDDADSDYVELEGGGRRLHQEHGPQFWNLSCPTAADVDLVSSRLIDLGLALENVLNAQQEACAGRALTAEELELEAAQTFPNKWWTLVPYMLDPDKLAAYVEANCTNQELGGSSRSGKRSVDHFYRYHGDWGDDSGHLEVNATFGMCVDNFGSYDTFARAEDIKDSACLPPFDDFSWCYALVYGLFFWPTTTSCADQLAKTYRVESEHTRAVLDIILEAKSECAAITTQEACETVSRVEYENNIAAVVESMPLRALGNTTLPAGSTSNATDSSPGLFPLGEPTEDSGAAAGVNDPGSGDTERAFPGLPLGQEVNEEDIVTEEDLQASQATPMREHSFSFMLAVAIICITLLYLWI